MQIEPLRDMVVIKRDEAADKIGEIFIPGNAKEPPKFGTVLAAGPGSRAVENGLLIETTLKKDDRVMFGPFAGVEIEFDGDKCLIMREDEVLGRVFD